MIFQAYILMMHGIPIAHYLLVFPLLAKMRSVLYENIEHVYHWNKNPIIKHAETNTITHSKKTNAIIDNVNPLKHLRAKMLSFNFLVKVSFTTYQ